MRVREEGLAHTTLCVTLTNDINCACSPGECSPTLTLYPRSPQRSTVCLTALVRRMQYGHSSSLRPMPQRGAQQEFGSSTTTASEQQFVKSKRVYCTLVHFWVRAR